MQLKEIVAKLDLKVLCSGDALDQDITRGYAGDLLSDVIANTNEGDIWVTMQIHMNVVAVAQMRDLAAVLIVNRRQPDEDTLGKAAESGTPVLTTPLTAFEVIGRLYSLGIGGT